MAKVSKRQNMIALLAVFGIVFFLKETDITSRLRILLISTHPIIGNLFDCYFCLGFWTSIFLYPLTHIYHYSIVDHSLFSFAGAASSFIIMSIIQVAAQISVSTSQDKKDSNYVE